MLARSINNYKNIWDRMSKEKLDFGVINRLEKQIAEVIIEQGIEINDAMVDEYHRYLDKHYSGDFGLLVNKINQYTYSFTAQQRLATLPNIKAIAVVVYRRSTEIATEALLNIKRTHEWNLKTFYDRDEALSWLTLQLSLETQT